MACSLPNYPFNIELLLNQEENPNNSTEETENNLKRL